MATARARSAGARLLAADAALSRVWPLRSTESSIRSAALRAPNPSTLGMPAFNAHLCAMKRPKHLHPPAHLSPSPPVPEREPLTEQEPPAGEETRLDPTRYGDWEKKGMAIDF